MITNDKKAFGSMLSAIMDVYGNTASAAATGVWWSALARFTIDQVRSAWSAHVQDPVAGKFQPKPADIIGRLQVMDGRPGPEEAWAMMPRDEDTTVVWTQEMASAWGVALPLLNERDQVAARMAFTEQYRKLVQGARDRGEPARWSPSLGADQNGRERALMDAVDKGRLGADHVAGLLPYRSSGTEARLLAILEKKHKALNDLTDLVPEEVGQP